MRTKPELIADLKAAIARGEKEQIINLFERNGLPWRESPDLACQAGEGLIKMGHYPDAITVLKDAEQRFPEAIRPRQLHALALARSGGEANILIAQDILEQLYRAGDADPETLGIYARTWMDRYRHSNDSHDLEQSRDFYARAFEAAPDDYYTGINAAAKSVLLGGEENLDKAAGYIRRLQQSIGTEPIPGDYWQSATVAEALLIQQQYEEAGRIYETAVGLAPYETGSHLSTWKQVCSLLEKLNPTASQRAFIRKAFRHLPECETVQG